MCFEDPWGGRLAARGLTSTNLTSTASLSFAKLEKRGSTNDHALRTNCQSRWGGILSLFRHVRRRDELSDGVCRSGHWAGKTSQLRASRYMTTLLTVFILGRRGMRDVLANSFGAPPPAVRLGSARCRTAGARLNPPPPPASGSSGTSPPWPGCISLGETLTAPANSLFDELVLDYSRMRSNKSKFCYRRVS